MIAHKIQINPPHLASGSEIEQFAESLNSPSLIAKVLWQRGIRNQTAARNYFLALPDEQVVSPPLLHLDRCIDRLMTIKDQGQELLIHGDYDVDGISGAALLYLGLSSCGIRCRPFLPNRFSDGYGMTVSNFDLFAKEGIKHVISVDTGITALAEVEHANQLGIEVMITDHHQPGSQLPPAAVIVNPNQPDCPYLNKALSGTGVAYRVVEALCIRLGLPLQENLLELVAIASLADMAPMTAENRYLIRKGLRLLSNTQRPGLRTLLQDTGMYGVHISSMDVLFKMTPLLNAAGRLESPDLALHFLLATNSEEAEKLLKRLKKINQKRKDLDREAFQEALIQASSLDPSLPCLVFYSPHWHEGILGILAAKLSNRFGKSVFVCTLAEDKIKGSGRAGPGESIHQILKHASETTLKWGGHEAAVGFTLLPQNLPAFKEKVFSFPQSPQFEGIIQENIDVDAHVQLAEVSDQLLLWFKRMEPMGPRNENPIFYSENIQVSGKPSIIGTEHLKFKVTDGLIERNVIAFGKANWLEQLQPSMHINLAYHIDKNSWGNKESIQLRALAYTL